MHLELATIIIVGTAFAAMGSIALVEPSRVAVQFGIERLNSDGKNEVRAVYGGFGLFMAFALSVALFEPAMRSGICFTLILALGGMAFGRVISAVVDKKLGRAPRLYLIIELIGASALLYPTLR